MYIHSSPFQNCGCTLMLTSDALLVPILAGMDTPRGFPATASALVTCWYSNCSSISCGHRILRVCQGGVHAGHGQYVLVCEHARAHLAHALPLILLHALPAVAGSTLKRTAKHKTHARTEILLPKSTHTPTACYDTLCIADYCVWPEQVWHLHPWG